jgi:hypothetical protein
MGTAKRKVTRSFAKNQPSVESTALTGDFIAAEASPNGHVVTANGQGPDLAELTEAPPVAAEGEVDEHTLKDAPGGETRPPTTLSRDDLFLDDDVDLDDEERILSACPCRQPRSSSVFRVRPGREWRAEVLIVQFDEEDPAIPRGKYVIAGELRRAFKRFGRRCLLVTCVTDAGQMFLWDIRITEGFGDSWYKSDLKIAKEAESRWLRFLGKNGNVHEAAVSRQEWGEPKWRGESLLALVHLAFDGRVVDSPNHPLCRRYEIG